MSNTDFQGEYEAAVDLLLNTKAAFQRGETTQAALDYAEADYRDARRNLSSVQDAPEPTKRKYTRRNADGQG